MIQVKFYTRTCQSTMSKPQLFCFPYAGGNASFFDEIEEDMPDIKLVKYEYPGHGKRHKEKLHIDFAPVADDAFRYLHQNYSGGHYSLFGYSMGTITLIEVYRRIVMSGMRFPDFVFLGAHTPYTKAELLGYDSDELDEKVKQRTLAFGAVPEALRNNSSFWRFYLPLFRADYTMIGKYRFEDLQFKSDIPAVVFYSETDTPFTEMRDWNKYFIKQCEFVEYKGMHFFIKDHHKEMAEIICNRLLPEYEVKK